MARRVTHPPGKRGTRQDCLEYSYARLAVLAHGLGDWSVAKRARDQRHLVAYVVRYSHGGVSWSEAMGLPLSELHRRGKSLQHWIKAENAPSK